MPEALPDSVYEAFDTLQKFAADQAAESGWDDLPTEASRLINERIRPEYPEVADYLESTMDSQDLMLIGDELTEAHEARRSGHAMDEEWIGDKGKPEGVPSEMSDAVIRVMHVMARKGVFLGGHTRRKLKSNADRGYRHGGRSF